MRLSRKVLLILIIAAFAIAFGFLFSNYSQAAAELSQLEDRLSSAQTRLPGLITQKQEAENQERQAASALDISRAKFPRSVESIEYGEGLFRTAEDSKVQITRLTASAPHEGAVGNIDYSIASFVVVVKGDVTSILDFIHALRTGREFEFPWSAHVKEVQLDHQKGEALIGLDIYGYRG